MRADERCVVEKLSFMHSPSFAYSSTVFFSPTLKPSVVEAWRSSSPWVAILINNNVKSKDWIMSSERRLF